MKENRRHGRKGQVFTLDVFLAIAAIVAAIGYVSMNLEQAYSSANDLQFQKINSLADDWAQIGAKRSLAYVDGDGNILANVVDFDDTTNWNGFVAEVTNSLTSDYSAELSLASNSDNINGGCPSKKFIATSRRLVIDPGTDEVNWLEVMICFA